MELRFIVCEWIHIWSFSLVLRSCNRGEQGNQTVNITANLLFRSPLFFLTKSFWGCKSKKKLPIENISELMDIANQTENINDIDTVQHEREKVLIQEREGNVNENGIRIIGIQKNYPKYPFGIKSDKDVQALKGVYLEVDSGELLSILGHNGAGIYIIYIYIYI